ncbi:MAG TPA: cytochrome P450 [Jatrophihabitantaceae bacterium]|jgi:cytochrome P450 family 142 subfamily A polypeptide 1
MTEIASRPVVDLMGGGFYAEDPHAAWTWMRCHEPVYHDETNDVWAVTRYQDVRTCSTDPRTFSNATGSRPKSFPTPMMIDTDPPTHSKRRKLVSAGFTPRRVAELREHVARTCDEVIDAVCEQSGCDFVADIAAQLPLIMIGDLLGVAPADRAELLRWSDEMLLSQGAPDQETLERATTAFIQYQSYVLPIIADRRATGFTGDLIGILANAEIDGDRLSDDDLVFDTLLILVGGDETTRHVLSGGMLALLENPEQLAALTADPAKLPGAVEEMLRWVSPLQDMARTLTRDATLNGVRLREGDQLMLFYPSANRDEDVFTEPFRFDIGRDPNPHLAFGLGNHFCLGNQLARLELLQMFPKLLQRMPDLHLAPSASSATSATSASGGLPRRASNFVSGLETMPVAYSPSARRVS